VFNSNLVVQFKVLNSRIKEVGIESEAVLCRLRAVMAEDGCVTFSLS
jgi:hypothetical protein